MEIAIRHEIGKYSGGLRRTDLQGLTTLSNACGPAIRNLSGLEYCSSLIRLDLSYNQISDISPLAGLSRLTWLNLSGNQISDISPLAGLTGLVELDLGYNQIENMGPLAN